MKSGKYKLKVCTNDNEPIIKATAERIEDFDPIMKALKHKLSGK